MKKRNRFLSENMKFVNMMILALLFFGVSISSVAYGQNSTVKPDPTWTEDQWESADPNERAKQEEVEMNQKIKEGKLTPVPFPKDFKGVIKPLPPTHLKITIVDGAAYLSWDKVKDAKAYIIFESKDGKNYKRRSYPVMETKFIIGPVAMLKNGPIKFYGVSSFYYGLSSEMVVRSIEAKDFDTK